MEEDENNLNDAFDAYKGSENSESDLADADLENAEPDENKDTGESKTLDDEDEDTVWGDKDDEAPEVPFRD